MEADRIKAYAVLAVLVGAAFLWLRYWRRRQEQLDAAVELSEADYIHSEFELGRGLVGLYLSIGLLISGGALYKFFIDEVLSGPAAVVLSLLGLGVIGYALYTRGKRVLIRDRKLISLRGDKTLWELRLAELESVTRVYNRGNESHLVLRTASGQSYKLPFANYEEGRKLKMMLLDPRRVGGGQLKQRKEKRVLLD